MEWAKRFRTILSKASGATDPPAVVNKYSPFDRLPVELWREIFTHATRVNGGYDTSYISAFDLSDITDDYHAFVRRVVANHRVKQTLCLVCRAWHAVADELLFEYLFLRDGFDWTTLADEMESSGIVHLRHGTGWYVRRLAIVTSSWTSEYAATASRIIHRCPNVRRIDIGGTYPYLDGVPLEAIRAIFDVFPRSQLDLHWTVDLGPATYDMFGLLSKLTRLQSFFMRVDHPFQPPATYDELCHARAVALPEVHTLEVASTDSNDTSAVLCVMAHWVLHSLKQVKLRGQQRIEKGLFFFTVHGPRLRALEFDCIGDDVDRVLESCSNLTDLVAHIRYAVKQILGGHKTVKRLGFRGLRSVEHSYANRRHAVEALKVIFPAVLDKKMYPRLEVVRLLDYDQTQFSEHGWRSIDVLFWASWVRKFYHNGVRIEDHEGKAMLPEAIAFQHLEERHTLVKNATN